MHVWLEQGLEGRLPLDGNVLTYSLTDVSSRVGIPTTCLDVLISGSTNATFRAVWRQLKTFGKINKEHLQASFLQELHEPVDKVLFVIKN